MERCEPAVTGLAGFCAGDSLGLTIDYRYSGPVLVLGIWLEYCDPSIMNRKGLAPIT